MHVHFLSKYIIVIIALMPFMTSTGLNEGFLSTLNPRELKTSWGVVSVLLGMLIWLKYSYADKILTIQSTKVYLPIFLFLLWCLIALFWSHNIYKYSITLVQYLSLGMVFFLITNIYTSSNAIKKLLNVFIYILFVVSVIGLFQSYYPDDFFIQNLFVQKAAPASTFINKNMASHFVVMILPLSIVYLLTSKSLNKIFLYSIISFDGLLFLLNIEARQAYLAIFIEFLILVLFFVLDFIKNNNLFFNSIILKKWKVFSIVLILFSLFIASNVDKNGLNFDSGSKLNKLQQINVEGGSSRIPGWVNTLEMVKDNPLVGVGVGQWSEHYPYYHDSAVKDVIFGDQNRFKKLHNDYLEMLASVGLVGFLLLVWILIITIGQVWRCLSSTTGRSSVLALTLGLVGFSVVALFSFPLYEYITAFVLMIFLALLGRLSGDNTIYKFKMKIQLHFALSATFFLLFAFSIFCAYNWIVAESFHQKSINSFNADATNLAISESKESVTYNPYNYEYHDQLAYYLLNNGDGKNAIPILNTSNDLTLFNSHSLLRLSAAYRLIGDSKNQQKVLERILKYDPKNIKALAAFVRLLFIKSEYDKANRLYSQLKNNFEYYKDRSNFGPYHKIITKLALAVQDYKYASYIYSDLVKRSPTAQRYAVYAVIEYQSLGNKAKAKELFEQALKLDLDVEIPQEIRDDLKL